MYIIERHPSFIQANGVVPSNQSYRAACFYCVSIFKLSSMNKYRYFERTFYSLLAKNSVFDIAMERKEDLDGILPDVQIWKS